LEDAIEAIDLGAASVIKKPDPNEEQRATHPVAEAYDAAFERDLAKVVAGIERGLARR
jgi:hypothetical protein